MFLFPEIAKDILRELILAEEQKSPLTLEEANRRWGKGSTWEDLVDTGYIRRLPEAVTVTEQGRQWYNSH